MAEDKTDQNTSNASSSTGSQAGRHPVAERFAVVSGQWLDRSDTMIYLLTGICFMLLALFTLGYSLWYFIAEISHLSVLAQGEQPTLIFGAIAELTADLLLVLIIAEILGTIIHYLKDHVTSLRPYFFIGIISAIRIIIALGAKLLLLREVAGPEFTSAMIELGVTTAVVLVLGFTLWFFETRLQNGVHEMEQPDRY
jgi:uncharacterized membrane protein (DUF373 family)